jgi:hypothetical protein
MAGFSYTVKRGRGTAKRTLEKLNATMPEAGNPETPLTFDREQAFLLYANFCGDVEKTAHALNIKPLDVLKIADDEEWNARLASIIKLKKSGKPGDVERGINRAMNFVQAHRMRCFLERMIRKLDAMSDDELFKYCLTETVKKQKDGTETVEHHISTRPFADLASALEKVHVLTYLSLSDQAADRSARKEQNAGADEASTQEIHSAIAEAMSKSRAATPRSLLTEAQLAAAPALSPLAEPPVK